MRAFWGTWEWAMIVIGIAFVIAATVEGKVEWHVALLAFMSGILVEQKAAAFLDKRAESDEGEV